MSDMILAGKAKEAFTKYFHSLNICQIEQFNSWTDSMKYGVYVDWFDSVGISVAVNPVSIVEYWAYCKNHKTGTYTNKTCKSRSEARTAAIEEANEIYNERFKNDKFHAA